MLSAKIGCVWVVVHPNTALICEFLATNTANHALSAKSIVFNFGILSKFFKQKST